MDNFLKNFDSVVMLTWSDWKTELRSNRYHYAKRFAQLVKVVFVQVDLYHHNYYFENTEIDNVIVLHFCKNHSNQQAALLNRALREKNIIKPLLWVYNCQFHRYLAQTWSPLVVYHATEDYFSDSPHQMLPDTPLYQDLLQTLKYTDLLVSVSSGIEENVVKQAQYSGDSVVITNGCDFKFYTQKKAELQKSQKKSIIYQGNINQKIDFTLLRELIERLFEYEFWFCGVISECKADWNAICKLPNVKYFGMLDCDALKNKMHSADVAIIPFKKLDYLTQHSFPLKAFEYLACGLPVVSVAIKSLLQYSSVIHFAENINEFETRIRECCAQAEDQKLIDIRLLQAKKQDYDIKFNQLLTQLHASILKKEQTMRKPLNILILYDANSVHVSTISEHLQAFIHYSENFIYYASTSGYADCKIDLSVFDVIYIHYSIRVSTYNGVSSLSPSYIQALKSFGGYKILFIQDEYDTTDIAKKNILQLGIHTVYTNVCATYLEAVYTTAEFKNVEFINTLTGYIPENLKTFSHVKPFAERAIWIGYRGRDLPFWYGNLGREKYYIGKEMKRICETKNIPCDIEWDAEKRIYGGNWYEFLSNCRATLGTESGSNVFDFTGDISKNIKAALAKNPSLSYEEVYEKYLYHHEGKIRMNQISPKIFEAIALRTALILFEGTYSDVIKPGLHFIELKKDFSNIEDVLAKLADEHYLYRLTSQAYDDIVDSDLYSYKKFVADCDKHLASKVIKKNTRKIIPILFASIDDEKKQHVSQLQMSESILSNTVLQKNDDLKMVNTLPSHYTQVNFGQTFSILIYRGVHKLMTHRVVTSLFVNLNNALPGKPISKIYRLFKRWFK